MRSRSRRREPRHATRERDDQPVGAETEGGVTIVENWDALVQAARPQDSSVTTWRIYILTRAGYPFEDAELLATHPTVDLHAAVWLIERGCPVETALRILL